MGKILLIEDDLPLLRMYQVAFSSSGHTFLHAADGEEGLKVAEKEKPDIILLDLVMPKRNGFEVLESLKNNKDLDKIPVICLTVLHQEEDMQRAKKLGAVDYIVKTDTDPMDVVKKVLSRLSQAQ